MPISIDAMAVHHITNKMVEDKPPFQGSPTHQKLSALISDHHNFILAHNARFDL
jgi:exodeoxyribonuclease X